MIKALQEELTEEELAAYKRGRNAKSATMAKHATMIDYRMATGLEALVGWLFLTEQYARLVELVSRGLVKAGFLEPWDEKGETEGRFAPDSSSGVAGTQLGSMKRTSTGRSSVA